MATPSVFQVPPLQKRKRIPMKIIRAIANHIAEKFDPAQIILFGSHAYGKPTAWSDVDLLVEFSRPVGLFQFIELQQRLEALLGRKVDLGTPRSLKPRIKEHVLREAILVA